MKEQNDVVENLEEKNEALAEEVNTDAEAVETESLVETVKEEVEVLEEKTEALGEVLVEKMEEEGEKLEEAEETLEEVFEEKNVKLSKHEESKALVGQARSIVQDAEAQLDECKLLLASDLKEYENAKENLKTNGLDESETLLKSLGFESVESAEPSEDMVVFEPKEELQPIQIQDISSGGFTGLVLALIAGALTYLVMVYVAAAKVGTTFYASHAFSPEALKPVMEWYATLVGMADKAVVGGAIIAAVVLLVMWIIYAIRVSIRSNRNMRMAETQLENAEAYSAQKGSCKEEMDKVDAYINESVNTLNLYQVILHEQKAKLLRIKHIENDKIETTDFHHKSTIEMQDTAELISAIKDFMSVPMSEEGKLSGKSSLFLHRAQSKIQKVLDRLY